MDHSELPHIPIIKPHPYRTNDFVNCVVVFTFTLDVLLVPKSRLTTLLSCSGAHGKRTDDRWGGYSILVKKAWQKNAVPTPSQ